MIFFAEEKERFADVEVDRLGPAEEKAEVQWRTLPSELEGTKFIAADGWLTFAPGEVHQSLRVELIDNDKLDSTLEFGIELVPGSEKGCELGIYLRRCRVKIIDDDVFPTNMFRDDLHRDPTCVSWRSGKSVNIDVCFTQAGVGVWLPNFVRSVL